MFSPLYEMYVFTDCVVNKGIHAIAVLHVNTQVTIHTLNRTIYRTFGQFLKTVYSCLESEDVTFHVSFAEACTSVKGRVLLALCLFIIVVILPEIFPFSSFVILSNTLSLSNFINI